MATNFVLSSITSVNASDLTVKWGTGKDDSIKFTADDLVGKDANGVKVTFDSAAAGSGLNLAAENIAITNIDLGAAQPSGDLAQTKLGINVDAKVDYDVNVTLGAGNDSVALKNSGHTDTIFLGAGAAGTNQITGFEANDRIDLGRAFDLDQIVLNSTAATNVSVTHGNSVVGITGDAVTAGVASLNIGNNGNYKKLVAALDDDKNLLATADDTYFSGSLGEKTSITAAGDITNIDLTNTSKYASIEAVVVDAAQKKDITIVADSTTGTSINAAAAKVATTITVNGNDTVALSAANNFSDTINITKGANTVDGFRLGLEKDDDVLVLSKASSLSAVTVDKAAAAVKAGGTTTELSHVTTTDGEVMKMQLSDGSSYNVAANYDADGADKISLKIDKATNVGGQKIVFLTEGKKGDAAASEIELQSTTTDATFAFSNDQYANNYYGAGVAKISGAASKGNMFIGDVQKVSVGSGNNIVWSYSKDDAEIDLTAGTGTDVVVLSANFAKNTTVEAFDAKTDALWAYSSVDTSNGTTTYTESLKDVVSAFKFGSDGAKTSISTGKVDDTEYVTTLNGIVNDTAIEVRYGFGGEHEKALKVKTGTGAVGQTLTFETDVNYYVNADEVDATAANVKAGTTVDVVLGNAASATSDTKVIYADTITKFDASLVDGATFNLTGTAAKSNILIGGAKGTNTLYGGGSSNDTLQGQVSSADTFKFGIFDGNDTIGTAVLANDSGLDKSDTINLWNLTETDIANVTFEIADDGTAVMNVNNGTLTMYFQSNTVAVDTLSQMSFTDINGAKYGFNADTKKLVKA